MRGKRRGNREEESESRAEGGPGRASRNQEGPGDNQSELGEDRGNRKGRGGQREGFKKMFFFFLVLMLEISSLYLPGE